MTTVSSKMHQCHLKYHHTYFDDGTYTLFLLKVCEFDKSFTLQATQVRKIGIEDDNQAAKLKVVRDADRKSYGTLNE